MTSDEYIKHSYTMALYRVVVSDEDEGYFVAANSYAHAEFQVKEFLMRTESDQSIDAIVFAGTLIRMPAKQQPYEDSREGDATATTEQRGTR